jgi:UDPglucose--hexose-1-phosphate uridylyltransferase
MPQLRQNIITGEWVVIAPERSKRPSDFIDLEPVAKKPASNCVFCLTSDNYQHNRLKDYENDDIYVIPNKYPAFVADQTDASSRTSQLDEAFYPHQVALGGHEVLVLKEHA